MDKRRLRPPEPLFDPPLEPAPSEPARAIRSVVEGAPDDGEDLVDCCFAIFPDDVTPGARARPIAIFDTLEDAMDWALQRFKGGAFRLRYERFVLLQDGDRPVAPNTELT